MERRLGIMQSVEPVLENAIKTLQKVVDVRGMGKSSLLQINDEDNSDDSPTIELIVSDFGEPAGEPEEHRNPKKNAEDSTSYVRQSNSMTIDGTKVSIDESNDSNI